MLLYAHGVNRPGRQSQMDMAHWSYSSDSARQGVAGDLPRDTHTLSLNPSHARTSCGMDLE